MWPFFRAAKACLPLVTFIRLGFDWLRQIMIEHQVLLNQDNGPIFLSHEPLFTLPWEKKGIQKHHSGRKLKQLPRYSSCTLPYLPFLSGSISELHWLLD